MKTEKSQELAGKRIAILATDGVEQVELTDPRKALDDAGAKTTLVSLKSGKIQAFNHHDKGDQLKVDLVLDEARAQDFDGLLLPGGVANPDALRANPRAVSFVKSFATAGKTIAAICHAPWLLVEADLVRGRHVTSWPSLKTDILNAGGQWQDSPVVVDRGLVTSRKPDDIPQFVAEVIEAFKQTQQSNR